MSIGVIVGATIPARLANSGGRTVGMTVAGAQHQFSSCQNRWPTTDSGNDLRIGRNERRPLGLPSRYLTARPSLSALFCWSPDAQPQHLCLGGGIVRHESAGRSG